MSEKSAPTPQTQNLSAYRLAAGMLWHDRGILSPLFVLLLLPVVVEAYFPNLSLGESLVLLAGQRFIQLYFLWFIGRRWIKLLTVKGSPVSKPAQMHFYTIGFAFWALLMTPLLVQLFELSDEMQLLAILMFVPLVIFWIRYFFYLFPFMIGVNDIKHAFSTARGITLRNHRAPWATMLTPFAFVVLICGLIYAISPDGRIAMVQHAAMVAAELFWPLACYLWLAFSLTLLSDHDWHQANLDPYREARFATMAVTAPKTLEKLLDVRTGIKILALAAVIWIANRVHLEALAPAPSIEILKAEADEDRVTLTLRLSDSEYNFRGFHPVYLSLAGKERHPVSTSIENIQSSAGGKELLYQIPPDLEQIEVTLSFRTNRSGDALKSLKDLYLWYRLTKLNHIELQ